MCSSLLHRYLYDSGFAAYFISCHTPYRRDGAPAPVRDVDKGQRQEVAEEKRSEMRHVDDRKPGAVG